MYSLLEGDEYPSSNTDNQSKFAALSSLRTVLLARHGALTTSATSFQRGIRVLSRAPSIISLIWSRATGAHRCGDRSEHDLSVRFLAEAKRDVTVTFRLTKGDWRAENIEYVAQCSRNSH